MTNQKNNANQQFVARVCEICQDPLQTGPRAMLRRGANPNTAHQSWPVLARCGVNLEWGTLPAYQLIAASIAQMDSPFSGDAGLGELMRDAAGADVEASDAPIARRLHRLLACDNLDELCLVLRPVLKLLSSKKLTRSLDYVDLLKRLRGFSHNPQWVRQRWAQGFYAYRAPNS